MNNETSLKKFVYLMINDFKRQNNIRKSIKSTKTYDHWIARESITHSIALIHLINKINENIWSLIAKESSNSFFFQKFIVMSLYKSNHMSVF